MWAYMSMQQNGQAAKQQHTPCRQLQIVHTPVNLSKGMSGMRPTFVAFSMLPTAIIEFVQAKNPTLQK